MVGMALELPRWSFSRPVASIFEMRQDRRISFLALRSDQPKLDPVDEAP